MLWLVTAPSILQCRLIATTLFSMEAFILFYLMLCIVFPALAGRMCWRNLLRGYILFIRKITFKVTDRAFRMGLEQRASLHYWANDRYGLGGQAGQKRAIKMSCFFFGLLVAIPETHWVFTECHISYGGNSDYPESDLREWYLANWYPVLVWQQPQSWFLLSRLSIQQFASFTANSQSWTFYAEFGFCWRLL